MFPTRFHILRFCLTLGLLLLLILVTLTTAYQPLKNHIIETQQDTSYISKSRVLSYQTPDFKLLAENILAGHVFSPLELDTWQGGTHYLSFYQKGAELFPELFEMHYMQGICHFWMGDLPSAESSLRQSLEINPVFFWTYYNLGLLYFKSGQIDAAIALLTRAQNIPPPVTKKFLHDFQTFAIILQYMPDSEHYIDTHLEKAEQQTNDLLMLAIAIKNHRKTDIHFDPSQWNPVFF